MDEADEGNAFGREERAEKKDEVVLITKFERISGPFLLRKLAQTPKRTASKVKTHVYANDPEDCLTFNYEFTALVERRNMIGIVGNVQFTDEDFHIDLDQEHCEEFLERIKGVEVSETDEWILNRNMILESGEPPLEELLRFPDRFY